MKKILLTLTLLFAVSTSFAIDYNSYYSIVNN